MALIDSTYFDGPLIIANVTTAPVEAAIEAAIAEYEPEFFRKLMGPSLYAAYLSGIAGGSGNPFSSGFSSGFGSGTIEDRWLWVRDGHEYTYNDVPYTWPGLAKALTQYVYCKYRLDNFTATTTGGEEIAQGSNVTTVSPAGKIMKEWAKMLEWTNAFAHMVYYLTDTGAKVYPEYDAYEPDSDVYNTLGYF